LYNRWYILKKLCFFLQPCHTKKVEWANSIWIIEEVNPVKWENKNYNKCHFFKKQIKIYKLHEMLNVSRTMERYFTDYWDLRDFLSWHEIFLTTFWGIFTELFYGDIFYFYTQGINFSKNFSTKFEFLPRKIKLNLNKFSKSRLKILKKIWSIRNGWDYFLEKLLMIILGHSLRMLPLKCKEIALVDFLKNFKKLHWRREIKFSYQKIKYMWYQSED
jgi:hypothetical protein